MNKVDVEVAVYNLLKNCSIKVNNIDISLSDRVYFNFQNQKSLELPTDFYFIIKDYEIQGFNSNHVGHSLDIIVYSLYSIDPAMIVLHKYIITELKKLLKDLNTDSVKIGFAGRNLILEPIGSSSRVVEEELMAFSSGIMFQVYDVV